MSVPISPTWTRSDDGRFHTLDPRKSKTGSLVANCGAKLEAGAEELSDPYFSTLCGKCWSAQRAQQHPIATFAAGRGDR